MAHTLQTIMVVCLDIQAGLMVARASQTRCTRPRVVFNSSLMDREVVNSWSNKWEIAPVHSSFLPLPWLMLFDSSEHFFIVILYVFFLGALSPYPPITPLLFSVSLCNCVGFTAPFLYLVNFHHSLGPHKFLLCNFTGASLLLSLSSLPKHLLTASLPSSPGLHIFPSIPIERGKSKRGVRYYNALSWRNRLSPSQLALIAHFSSPRHNNQESLDVPPSSPHLLHGFSPTKREAPPSCARIPLATSLLPPPKLNPQDPYYGDGSCMVEEEIPLRWQVEENIVVVSEDKEEGQPHLFSNHLTEDNLQLIFEIRKKQDDQMHSQRILGQRMDIIFYALAEDPAWTQCPMCI
jgi:hypothetical protein